MQNPKVPHMNAALKILRYLRKDPDIGLVYKKCDKGKILDIYGFADADWAGSVIDRSSISGYCISLCGNLVEWTSKKQNGVDR